jgi:3-oxoacyl-[acyl-carrier-protein] synthase-3
MLHLHGLGHFHPENEITNGFLEALDIGTTEQWILERVGVRARRTTLPLDYIRTTRNRDPRAAAGAALYTHAEAGRRAAEMAMARAGVSRTDIGLVVAGSSANDTVTPAEACNIAGALDLDVPAFDVNSACTSFFVHLHLLDLMRPDALPPFVLVVVPEAVTRAIDYTDRATAVLFGDGAVAAVISARVPGRALVASTTLASRPAAHDKVVIPRGGHFRQEGRTVQAFAVKTTARLFQALATAHADPGRTLHFVGHQANRLMLEAVCRECNIPPARHHTNVEWFGNTAAAGAPSVISMRWDEWTATDDVAVIGVGAGFTWSSHLLRFEAAA